MDVLRHDVARSRGVIATVAKTVASRKAKGQGYMKQKAGQICSRLSISPTDLRGASGGQAGPDLLLSKAAQTKFPFVVEIKRQELLQIPAWLRQAEKYADSTGLKPLLIFKQNNQKDYCVLRFDDFLAFMQSYNALSELRK